MNVPDADRDDDCHRLTREGALQGARSDGALVWYGVPYAAPPVGAYRWRAPRPPLAWNGVRDATRRLPPAKQMLTFSTPLGDAGQEGATVGDEDCLHLTIWSPREANTPEGRTVALPVLVWFHGGGNLVGDGADTNAATLVASQKIIVVSINHRLGVLGWFTHRALRDADGGQEVRSGNFAVLDHIRALEWISANVAAFGGDPSCVTLFGHSGGGWNVRALLCSPLAKGLFHRAIIQSVAAFQLMTPQHAENFVDDDDAGHPLSSSEVLLSLWLQDGRASDAATAKAQIRRTKDAEMASYLRTQTYEALAEAIAITRKRNAAVGSREAITAHSARRLPQMFADGIAVTDRIQSCVPIMVGSTRYEDRAFLSSNPKYVTSLYGHPVIRDRRRYQIVSEYFGKLYKAHGVDQQAAQWHREGLSVYAYRCDWDEIVSPPWLDFRALVGACHGSELPLIFGTSDLGREYAFQRHFYDENIGSSFHRMSTAMMSYWTAFARDGAPGTGGDGSLPEWRSWGDGGFLVLNAEAYGGLRMSLETLTETKVIEQIRNDPRLPTGPARRRLVGDLRGYALTQLGAASYRALES